MIFEHVQEGDLVLIHQRVKDVPFFPLNCWMPVIVTKALKSQFHVGKNRYHRESGNLIGGGKGRRLGCYPSEHARPYTEANDETKLAEAARMAVSVRNNIDKVSKQISPAIVSHSDYIKPSLVDSVPLLEKIQAKTDELAVLVQQLNETK